MIFFNRKKKLKYNNMFKEKSVDKIAIVVDYNSEAYYKIINKIKKNKPITIKEYIQLCYIYSIDFELIFSLDKKHYRALPKSIIDIDPNDFDKIKIKIDGLEKSERININDIRLENLYLAVI